jgi:hypothetical protein
MSAYPAHPRQASLNPVESLVAVLRRLIAMARPSRGAAFGLIIVGGLLGFEIFNYGTTEFALADLLGAQQFAGVRWATILALAFCAIDFAGIARLFTPERGRGEPTEVWYLLGAWFLAATMNATLTWWGVSLALLGHQGLGNEILGREALLNGVPVFVAVLVWLIRVLMIGTLTLAGERLFTVGERRPGLLAGHMRVRQVAALRPTAPSEAVSSPAAAPRPLRSAPKPAASREELYDEASMPASSSYRR